MPDKWIMWAIINKTYEWPVIYGTEQDAEDEANLEGDKVIKVVVSKCQD